MKNIPADDTTNIPANDTALSPACAFCASSNVTSREEELRFDYASQSGVTELSALVQVHTCSDCGGQFGDESMEDAKHDAVCRHLAILTPSEIRAVRTNAKLSRAEFANATGLGVATIASWDPRAFIQTTPN